MTNKNKTNKQNTKERKKNLKELGFFLYLCWMLLQAPPPTQESGEGIPIDTEAKVTRHEGEQQWGGGGGLARDAWKKNK